MTTDETRDPTAVGSALALLGGVLMGSVGVAGKFGALAGLSPFQMLAAQVSLLVPVSGLLLWRHHGAAGFRANRPWRLVVRTLSGFLYFSTFYASLKGIPVADALVLESTNPFFAMVITSVLFKKRPSRLSLSLAAVAFTGVCLILIQHSVAGLLNPYALLGLLAGVGRAAGSVATGFAAKTEPTDRIIFYYALGMLLFSLAALPWEWRNVDGDSWWILLAPALLFVPQNFVYTISNRLIPAYLVGAMFYSAILVGMVADRLIWSTEIGMRGLAGTLLVVAAGLGLVWERAHRSRHDT